MSTSITVYGGAGEIGGNQIRISDRGASIWLDFGCPMSRRGRLYGDYMGPRSTLGMSDLLATGLVPELSGMYREDLLPGEQRRLAHGDRPLAVLLTHCHLDHSTYISLLDPDIPVYSSLATALMAKAHQDTSPDDLEGEVAYIIPREERQGLLAASRYKRSPACRRRWFVFGELSDKAMSAWRETPSARAIEGTELEAIAGNECTIGPFTVRHYPVDHSVPGSSAWAVKTAAGWIVYTGDLRFHGARADLSRQAVSEIANLQPAVLICEATHPAEPWPSSEEGVRANALNALAMTRDPIVVDCGARNVERLAGFGHIARQLGRRLAVTPKQWYMLEMLGACGRAPVDLSELSMFVPYSRLNRPTWERVTIERCTSSQFTNAPGADNRWPLETVLSLGYYDIDELLDLQPERGVYVRSTSEAWGEEAALDLERLMSWLNMLGMQYLGPCASQPGLFHSSGHTGAFGLRCLIEQIGAGTVIPVHTERSQMLRRLGARRVTCPVYGKPVPV